jgi:hypothetical protein
MSTGAFCGGIPAGPWNRPLAYIKSSPMFASENTVEIVRASFARSPQKTKRRAGRELNSPHLSRYSDGLRAGRLEFDSRGGKEICVFSTEYRSALGPTQPPIQWVPGALSRG